MREKMASVRCRFSSAFLCRLATYWRLRTTALPSVFPLFARAPGYLSLFVAVYPGLLLILGTVALPALDIRVVRFVALPRPCTLLPYVLQGRERAEYGSSLPIVSGFTGYFRLGYKGSLEVWPRYASNRTNRVAPRLPLSEV